MLKMVQDENNKDNTSTKLYKCPHCHRMKINLERHIQAIHSKTDGKKDSNNKHENANLDIENNNAELTEISPTTNPKADNYNIDTILLENADVTYNTKDNERENHSPLTDLTDKELQPPTKHKTSRKSSKKKELDININDSLIEEYSFHEDDMSGVLDETEYKLLGQIVKLEKELHGSDHPDIVERKLLDLEEDNSINNHHLCNDFEGTKQGVIMKESSMSFENEVQEELLNANVKDISNLENLNGKSDTIDVIQETKTNKKDINVYEAEPNSIVVNQTKFATGLNNNFSKFDTGLNNNFFNYQNEFRVKLQPNDITKDNNIDLLNSRIAKLEEENRKSRKL